MKFHEATEVLIGRLFYKNPKATCHGVGLQSPLWWWTHRASLEHTANIRTQETGMVKNLVAHLLHCAVPATSIEVVAVSREHVKELQAAVATVQGAGSVAVNPVDFHSTPQKKPMAVKIVAFGCGVDHLQGLSIATEKTLAESILDTQAALVVVSHLVLTSSECHTWREVSASAKKLQELDFCYSASAKAREGCVAAKLPVCCSQHTASRFFASNSTAFHGFCKVPCMRTFEGCEIEAHACFEDCHPAADHAACPYPCQKVRQCGHNCLMMCSQPCDCLVVEAKDLPCSHKVVDGFDADNFAVQYKTVAHRYVGSCDSFKSCEVLVTTQCRQCHGQTECVCDGAANETSVTLCAACEGLNRTTEESVRVEVIKNVSANVEKLKKDVRQKAYEQQHASAKGIFIVGQVVNIAKASALLPPDPAGFPTLSNWANLGEVHEGESATVVDRRVDISAEDEMQYVVRTRNGQHTLIAAEGLQLVKVVASNPANTSMLLLTGPSGAAGADAQAAADGGEAAPELHVFQPNDRAFVHEKSALTFSDGKEYAGIVVTVKSADADSSLEVEFVAHGNVLKARATGSDLHEVLPEGTPVAITESIKQVVEQREKQAFAPVVLPRTIMASVGSKNEVSYVVGAVNHPVDLSKGAYYVLVPKKERTKQGGGHVFLMPYAYVEEDVVAIAELKMEADMVTTVKSATTERIDEAMMNVRIRNEEILIRKAQAVADAKRLGQRTAADEPPAFVTKDKSLSAAQKNAVKAEHSSATSRMKDNLRDAQARLARLKGKDVVDADAKLFEEALVAETEADSVVIQRQLAAIRAKTTGHVADVPAHMRGQPFNPYAPTRGPPPPRGPTGSHQPSLVPTQRPYGYYGTTSPPPPGQGHYPPPHPGGAQYPGASPPPPRAGQPPYQPYPPPQRRF